MINNKPKVSIIVPVYNVENYLNRCLDSLINQSFDDIEIICINDGSTDRSLEILKDYEKKDNRVKIINKENSGVSNCRNKGIKVSNGEYIVFVDSDDWIDIDTYEIMMDNIIKYNADIAVSNINYVYDDRYLATVNFRADGSSRFAKRNRWGYFPSVSLGWRVSNI